MYICMHACSAGQPAKGVLLLGRESLSDTTDSSSCRATGGRLGFANLQRLKNDSWTCKCTYIYIYLHFYMHSYALGCVGICASTHMYMYTSPHSVPLSCKNIHWVIQTKRSIFPTILTHLNAEQNVKLNF